MKKIIIKGLFCFSFLSTLLSVDALTISPNNKVDLVGAPGKTIAGKFLVTNEKETEQTYYILVRNNLGFYPNEESDTKSVAQNMPKWFNIMDSITLKKGQALEIPYSIKIPNEINAGDGSTVIFFSSTSTVMVGSAGRVISLKIPAETKSPVISSTTTNTKVSASTSVRTSTTATKLKPTFYCLALSKNLIRNSNNAEVFLLQQFLFDNTYLNIEPTGFYGIQTVNAVREFQKDNKISPLGTVGPITMSKINSLNCKNPSSTNNISIVTKHKVNLLNASSTGKITQDRANTLFINHYIRILKVYSTLIKPTDTGNKIEQQFIKKFLDSMGPFFTKNSLEGLKKDPEAVEMMTYLLFSGELISDRTDSGKILISDEGLIASILKNQKEIKTFAPPPEEVRLKLEKYIQDSMKSNPGHLGLPNPNTIDIPENVAVLIDPKTGSVTFSPEKASITILDEKTLRYDSSSIIFELVQQDNAWKFNLVSQ